MVRQRLTAMTCKPHIFSLHVVYMFLFLATSVSACEKEFVHYHSVLDSLTDILDTEKDTIEGYAITDRWVGDAITDAELILTLDSIEASSIRVCPGPDGRLCSSCEASMGGQVYLREPEHDTAREYMVVDTVLMTDTTGWRFVYPGCSVFIPFYDDYVPVEWAEGASQVSVVIDTTYRIDTTWLPKAQVWMDSTEYRDYLEWLEGDTLIWPSIGHIIDSLDGIVEKYQK